MELFEARAIVAKIFEENGFLTWALQASQETNTQQIRRLAIRAVNTTPLNRRECVTAKLVPLLI